MNENQTAITVRNRDSIVEEQTQPVTGAHVTRFLSRYKFLILIVFSFTALAAYATLSLLTEQYTTEARLLVKLGRENIDPPPTVRNTVLTTGVRREEVASEIQILKSPDLADRAVDEIGLQAFRQVHKRPESFIGQLKFYAKAAARAVKDQYQEMLIALDLKKRLDERHKAILSVRDDVDVRVEKESDVIVISMRSPNPELARKIEEKLIELYFQRRTEVRQFRGVDTFLNKESETLKGQLASIELNRNAWMRDHGLSSSGDQKGLLLRQIRDLSTESNKTQRDLEALTRELNATRRELDATPANLKASQQEDPNPLVQTLKEKVAALRGMRGNLLTKYQEGSDPVKNIDEEIRKMGDLLAKEKSTQAGAVIYHVNPLRQNLEKNIQDANIRLAGLRSKAAVEARQSAALEAELRSVSEAEAKLYDLERDRQIAERSYMEFLKRKQDADIATQLDTSRISNVSVVSPPVASLQPVYPPKALAMGVALLMGLVLGIAFAMLLDYMDDRVYDAKVLESVVMIPCIAAVSFAESRRR